MHYHILQCKKKKTILASILPLLLFVTATRMNGIYKGAKLFSNCKDQTSVKERQKHKMFSFFLKKTKLMNVIHVIL